MKTLKLFLVVLFFVPLVLSGQISNQTVGGWKITGTNGSVTRAYSRVVTDTAYNGKHSQLYVVNGVDGSSVIFEKKYSQIFQKSSWTQAVVFVYLKKFGLSFPNNNYIYVKLYFGDNAGYTNILTTLYVPGWVYTAWYPITFPVANAPNLFNRVKIVIELNGTENVEVLFDALALTQTGEPDGVNIDDFEDTTVPVEKEPTIPTSFKLFQNYPNPFNPATSIKYIVSSIKYVNLTVYDALGREIAILVNEEKFPGEYEIQFNGSNLSSGTYFYVLRVGNFSETKKMLLLR